MAAYSPDNKLIDLQAASQATVATGSSILAAVDLELQQIRAEIERQTELSKKLAEKTQQR